MNRRIKTERDEYFENALLLLGASNGMATTNPPFAELLKDCSEKLKSAGEHLCCQGIFGCYMGDECTSDHK